MKILRVIASTNPIGGGPIEGIKQASQALLSLGHETDVVCLDAPDSPWLQNFPFPIYALGPTFTGYKYCERLVPWLRKNVDRYNCVIVEGLWQFSSFGTWIALHRSRVPYFVYTHGMLDPWFKYTYPLKHLKKWLYWPWAEYRVLSDATAILFTSQEEQLLARKSFWLYKCNEAVVGYGTIAPSRDTEKKRELFLKQFPELQQKKIILFLGRIHPKKGCDLLIDAFARVASMDSILHLVISGPDQVGWQKNLQARINDLCMADRVTWTGMLENDLKWGAFHSAEVFVLPSHQENFGVAVVEAMACGVPVIISNKVNIWREILADGAGLVSNDEITSLTESLHQWLSYSLVERKLMGQRAKQSFTQRFEIGCIASHFVETLTRYGVG